MIILRAQVQCPTLSDLESWLNANGWTYQTSVRHNDGTEAQKMYSKYSKQDNIVASKTLFIPGKNVYPPLEDKIESAISDLAQVEEVSEHDMWLKIMGQEPLPFTRAELLNALHAEAELQEKLYTAALNSGELKAYLHYGRAAMLDYVFAAVFSGDLSMIREHRTIVEKDLPKS